MKPGTKLAILLISGVIMWGSIFFAVGCSNNTRERAKAVAEKALMACVDCPETVKISAVSKPDSVFGRDYVTQDEQLSIAMAMLKINQKVMDDTDGMENLDFENKEMTELMERQMSALSVLRSLVSFESPEQRQKPKPFNGWKVKIEYEAKTVNGSPYRSEYWFILDKDADCVVNAFEIPVL